jgi:hypothetical protein
MITGKEFDVEENMPIKERMLRNLRIAGICK